MKSKRPEFGSVVAWKIDTRAVWLKIAVEDQDGNFLGWIPNIELEYEWLRSRILEIENEQNLAAQGYLPWF